MAVDLRPCPFCSWDGTKSVHAHDQLHLREADHTSFWLVRCPNCGASGPPADENAADSWWNMRPIENALRAEIDSLKTEIIRVVQVSADFMIENQSLRSTIAQMKAELAEYRASIKCKEEMIMGGGT